MKGWNPRRAACHVLERRPGPIRRRVARLHLAASYLAAGFSMATSTTWARTARADEPVNPYQVLDQLGETLAIVESNYVTPVDRAQLYRGALRGMLEGLDPHSTYFSRNELQIFEGDTTGRFAGVGVEVDFVDGEVLVIAPIAGSPAARAGIQPGDALIAIDGVLLDGRKPAELVERMRGPAGTKLTLTVRQKSGGHLVDHVLVRESIAVASIRWAALPNSIGYVRIKAFQEGTHRDLLRAMAALRAELGAPQGLILDLRNNPGGLVNEAAAVADEFLSAGNVYTARGRHGITSRADARPGGAYVRGPLVVLVNEFSASAAELVAAALKDHARARLVGARTFGKGSVQTLLGLPHDTAVKLTTSLYYSPNGLSLQARGVEPHVVVDPGYVPSSRVAVVGEKDLAGHLETHTNPSAAPEVRRLPPTNELLHLGVAREITGDPEASPDLALRAAFRLLAPPDSRITSEEEEAKVVIPAPQKSR